MAEVARRDTGGGLICPQKGRCWERRWRRTKDGATSFGRQEFQSRGGESKYRKPKTETKKKKKKTRTTKERGFARGREAEG